MQLRPLPFQAQGGAQLPFAEGRQVFSPTPQQITCLQKRSLILLAIFTQHEITLLPFVLYLAKSLLENAVSKCSCGGLKG